MQTWEYFEQGSDVPLLVTRPHGPARAALLLMQEAFGLNDHMKEVCSRFADQGYLVVAPALFHRMDVTVFEYSNLTQAKEALGRLEQTEILQDVSAAAGFAALDPVARGRPMGAIGFCFGGKVSFLAATELPILASSVSFYGAGIGTTDDDAPVHHANRIQCPVLAVYGDQDPMISSQEVAQVEEGLQTAGVPHLVRTYPGAGHGFFCDARPANFHPAAAQDAWELTLGFLQRTLRV